jgi:hypothetical protein
LPNFHGSVDWLLVIVDMMKRVIHHGEDAENKKQTRSQFDRRKSKITQIIH